MIGRSVLRCAATVCVLALLAGCQVPEEDSSGVDRSTGPLADERYQWTAAPGIDLVRGAAVPVRAFVESRLDAQFTQSLDYAYPGFDRAVPERSTTDDGADVMTDNLRPDVTRGGALDAVRVGNNRFSIQSLARTGDIVIATLCNYRYGLALELDNGKFASVARDSAHDDGIDAMQVRLTAPAAADNALPPQQGPAPAPSNDVFGDWTITGFLASYSMPDASGAAVWPSLDADIAKCVAESPDPPERRAFLIEGEHPRSEFPTSPPAPGWPDAVRR